MGATYMDFGSGTFHVDGDDPLTQEQVDSVWHHLPTTGAGWVEKGRLFVQQFDGAKVFDLGPVARGVKGVSDKTRLHGWTHGHKRHHAAKRTSTKKKSPAQLQREIDEALARAPKKVAGFAMPATRQPGYQIVSVPLLKGPRGIGPSGLDSPREHKESVVFATRAEAEAYLPSVQRFAADFGREAIIKEVW